MHIAFFVSSFCLHELAFSLLIIIIFYFVNETHTHLCVDINQHKKG
jgi:hypothetical protein